MRRKAKKVQLSVSSAGRSTHGWGRIKFLSCTCALAACVLFALIGNNAGSAQVFSIFIVHVFAGWGQVYTKKIKRRKC